MMSRAALLLLACLAAGAAARELSAPNPCRGKRDGSLHPVGDCSPDFIQCWKGKPLPIQSCPQGLVFNPATRPQGCAYPGAVGTSGCNCKKAYKGSKDMQRACKICMKARSDNSYFALPGNSRVFVQCDTLGPHVTPCTGSLRWSERKQNCV